jgi:hypothetical protein
VSEDTAAIIAAAERFLRAWSAATGGDDTLSPPDPAVLEVHEAAQELMRATGTEDLQSAYDVLDALVSLTKLVPSTN